MDPIVLICSVELELQPLLDRLGSAERAHPERREWTGTLAGKEVLAVAGGMGKTNAAHALTAVLERTPCSGVIGFGVGGAYPGTGIQTGDVVLCEREIYGDEGVETPAGWMSCEGIGIPLLENDLRTYYNEFPSDPEVYRSVRAALADDGRELPGGSFVTVSACSGTEVRGRELAERFEAVCETMEGAAYAHVAAIYGKPYLGLRGISNLVENRDRSRWRLHEAAEAAAAAIATAVGAWPAGRLLRSGASGRP